jgi:hypothetical protein
MRNYLMDYLLFHASDPSGDLMSLTWRTLAMMHASEIQSELRHKGFFRDAIISTLKHYAHYMRIANVNRCIYANAPELCLIARSHSLNIAVYQVDPCSSQQYVLIQEFVGDPMLPTAPLCPFFSFRFAHSLSSLRVIFSVKSSSLEVFEQPFFLTFLCQSLTWAPCLYGMGQLPLFICPPPPLLINLLPPLFTFFHWQEAHGWRQDGKNVDFFGGRPNEGKAQMIRRENGGGALEESVTKIVTF